MIWWGGERDQAISISVTVECRVLYCEPVKVGLININGSVVAKNINIILP